MCNSKRYILKLLHPIIPFITEDIYSNFTNELLINQSYASSIGYFKQETESVEKIISLIQKIRETRLSYNVIPSKRISLVVDKNNIPKSSLNIINEAKLVLSKITDIEKIDILEKIDNDSIKFVSELGEFYFYKNEVVDTEKEREKINKDIEKICSELKILESRILNPNFVSRAPQQLVEKEKSRYEYLLNSKNSLEEKLKNLK